MPTEHDEIRSRSQARRQSSDRFARQLGLAPEELWRAANAVWSNLNPDRHPFDRALSLAGVALRAAAEVNDETKHAKGRDCARTEEVLENYRRRAIKAEARNISFEWRHLRDVPRGWYFRLNADDPKWRLLNTEATWLWHGDARVQCRPPKEHRTSRKGSEDGRGDSEA